MAFFVKVMLLSMGLAAAFGKPAQQQFYPSPQPQFYSQDPYSQQKYTTPVPIIEQKQELNPDGSYHYKYVAGNGIQAEENGYIKNLGVPEQETNSVGGYFLYPGPNGEQFLVEYTADEGGFQPKGAHFPTPPPPPPELVKAYAEAPNDGVEYDDQGNPINKPSYRQ